MNNQEQIEQFPNESKLNITNIFKNLKYGDLVLFLTGGGGCIQNSANRSGIQFEEIVTSDMQISVTFLLNKILLSEGSGDSAKEARLQATNMGLQILQKECYSIKQNLLFDVIKIEKNNNQVVCDVVKQKPTTNQLELTDKEIDKDNIGYKIMKKMGWSGGGLGRNTQGRENPVGYLLKNDREGLGCARLDRYYFKNILKNYVESDDIRDLKFETSFLKEERKILHSIAHQMQLKSTSQGQGDQRGLTISKKIPDKEILRKVLIEKDEKYCRKYFVQVPEAKAELFPDNIIKLNLDSSNG